MKATINVSVKAFTPMCEMPLQLDAAGNQWFSGTQMRQGQRAFPRMESLSTPKSKWVTGAGLKYPAEKQRRLGCVSGHPPKEWNGPTVNTLEGAKKASRDPYCLLTISSNGRPQLVEYR